MLLSLAAVPGTHQRPSAIEDLTLFILFYKWRTVYIRRILSHAEYDEKDWLKG